jgi:predicted ATPase
MTLSAKPCLQSASIHPDADIDFSAYPHNIAAVREMGKIAFHPDVTFLVGENGAGKSTVLEAIALALGYGPKGGTKNFRLETTGELSESVSKLHEVLRLSRSFRKPQDGFFLRAESFYNFANYME